MRGRIIIAIWRRVQTESRRYKDKWQYLDKVSLTSIKESFPVSRFKFESLRVGNGRFIITKDERTFIKIVKMLYGPGDYCIKLWAKGKEKGMRVYWDGIVSPDGRFMRRKNTGQLRQIASMFERGSLALHSNQYISRFMRTKRPGEWHAV